jgi:Rod binding domain-containing protein
MKCSASQTTSSAHSVLAQTDHHAADDAKLHAVATQFEALLVNIALRPALKSLGPMSEVVGQQLSMTIASGMSEPLYEQLRSQIGS